MSEILSGKLDQLPLLEILKLVVNGDQSGRLDLTQAGSTGQIYLQRGKVVHAVVGDQLGEVALYSLMNWLEGDFDFSPDVEAPEKSITISTDQLLADGADRAKEWAEIKKTIPSNDVVLKLSSQSSSGNINLQNDQWQVLAQVNGAHSVAEIAATLSLDEFSVAKVLHELIGAGLLEIGEKPKAAPKPMMNGVFFDQLSEQFVDLIGPLGPVIIDQSIKDLKENRGSFPRDKVADLVEQISAEIGDEEKRTGFQQIMLDLMRTAGSE